MKIEEIAKELSEECIKTKCLECPFYLEDNIKHDYCFFKYNPCPPCDWEIQNV